MCELDLYFIGLSEIHWVCGQDLSKIHQLLWKLRLCSCGRAANPDCHLNDMDKKKLCLCSFTIIFCIFWS